MAPNFEQNDTDARGDAPTMAERVEETLVGWNGREVFSLDDSWNFLNENVCLI